MGVIKIEKFKPEPAIFEDDYFKLVKSDKPNWWLIAHKDSNITIEFEEKKYNETQQISELTPIDIDMMTYARIFREIGNWLSINHQNLL